MSQGHDNNGYFFIPMSWASWVYSRKFLPKEFYCEEDHPDSLQTLLTLVSSHPWIDEGNKLCKMDTIQRLLLALGIALRDYDEAHFTAPEALPTDFPDYALNTTLIGHNSLIGAVNMIVRDIEK